MLYMYMARTVVVVGHHGGYTNASFFKDWGFGF